MPPIDVSTHSRPKAAGTWSADDIKRFQVSTHSRPKAAGQIYETSRPDWGFNTQPPEGGWAVMGLGMAHAEGFNTQPPEGGWLWQMSLCAALPLFQHTAARRRLALRGRHNKRKQGFNTQPPEGGWTIGGYTVRQIIEFQHTAARRRLGCGGDCSD